jgi:hypothetical protein
MCPNGWLLVPVEQPYPGEIHRALVLGSLPGQLVRTAQGEPWFS